MKTLTKVIIAIALLAGIVILPGMGFAAIYYVGPNGDDSYTDAKAQNINTPWKTIGRAFHMGLRPYDTVDTQGGLKPGDRIQLLSGTISTGGGEWGIATYYAGAEGAPIILEPAPGHSPFVELATGADPNQRTLARFWIMHSYWTIRNLEFGPSPTIIIVSGATDSHVNQINIENNKFNGPSWEIFRTGVGSAENFNFRHNTVWLSGGSVTSCRALSGVIEYNEFHYLGRAGGLLFKGGAQNMEVRYNKFIFHPGATASSVIFLGGDMIANDYDARNITIHDNLIYNFTQSIGVAYHLVGAIVCWDVDGANIYNNMIHLAGGADYDIGFNLIDSYAGTPPKNIVIKNNIIYATGQATLLRIVHMNPGSNPPPSYTSDNNIWHSTTGTPTFAWFGSIKNFDEYKLASGQDANSIVADPLFVDPANNDFHLQVASPAIDAGAMLSQNWPDFDGTARPQGSAVDIGAYEYVPDEVIYTISGRIIDKFGNPVQDIGISLSGTRGMYTQTTQDGTYQFSSVVEGSYLIRPYLSNASFIPEELSAIVTNSDLENYNFILNKAPILSPIGQKAIGIGQTLSFTVSATDPDNDALTYSAENLPTGAAFTNRVFSWTPTQTGTYYVIFKVIDIDNLTVQENVKITVLTEFYPGDGNGLKGEYFSNKDLSGTPVLVRVDPVINFTWSSTQSPDPSIPLDYFSIRWSGEILAPTTGSFKFSIYHDDGIRLWLNNQLLIDNWKPQSGITNIATIDLQSGVKYPIILEYSAATSTEVIQLYWENPASTKTIIQQEYLYSTGQVPTPLPGDFNNDNVVDIKDLILVAKDYGTTYNISHIILVAENYGRTQ